MYDIIALRRKWPAEDLRPSRGSSANPMLRDFLEFGYLSELCRLILDKELEEPYASIALTEIPVTAMLAAAMQKAVELTEAKHEGK
jgi:hypothetical protein